MNDYQKLDKYTKKITKQPKFKDHTLLMAYKLIVLAHHDNYAKAQLIKNIDKDNKHYGDKMLLGYTNKHHHLLVMELPLNDKQYQILRTNAQNW